MLANHFGPASYEVEKCFPGLEAGEGGRHTLKGRLHTVVVGSDNPSVRQTLSVPCHVSSLSLYS